MEMEAMMERCRPLKVGFILILGMMLTMTLVGLGNETSLVGLITMYAAAALTLLMMFSFCENGNLTAAWMSATISPVLIALFAFQIQAVLAPLFMK